MKWSVLDWNETAITFYDSLGATPRKEWLEYRLSNSQMAALASADSALEGLRNALTRGPGENRMT